ncbi:MAG: HAMP domain-containing histidine kinase [Phycisphaerales bacterium]|nr:HAMP domain-containing histidine kinase [Phycisphaerales bacterium]
MRIQQKFGLLYAVLSVTAAINIGVAAWSMLFLARELSWPLLSMQEVLLGLHQLKRGVEDQSAALGFERGVGQLVAHIEQGQPIVLDRGAFDSAVARARDAMSRLEANPSYLVRSGVSTTRNLRDRLSEIESLAARWWDAPSSEQRLDLAARLGSLHELIERLEGRILADATLAVDHERELGGLVKILLIVSGLGVVLAGVLGAILVRRWLIRPVSRLREAALRIGSGDLSHRVEVRGGDELAELSREVNHMAETLAQMHEERIERERLAAIGEMNRRIVHNLRRPLSGIRALAETTRAELPPDSDLVEVQDRILRAVDRFEGWLRDVLRASTPLELSVRETEVEPWVRALLDAHRPEAETRGVVLSLHIGRLPGTVRFDPSHLGHALSAVISNAIEFSPEGATVSIDLTSENSKWHICVSDAGPGVPPDLAEAIFRPYMTTRPTGTGIGLAIARRVAEQHGGTIRLVPPSERPQASGGSVFEFTLPLQ